MKKHMKWLMPCLILVAAILIITVIALIATRQEAGALQVVACKGIASVTRGEEHTFLSEGQKIRPGDLIATDANSSARIRVGDSILLIEPQSEVRYDRIKEGDAYRTVFRLESGSILADVKADGELIVTVDPPLDTTGKGLFRVSLVREQTAATIRTTLVAGQIRSGEKVMEEQLKTAAKFCPGTMIWEDLDVRDAVLLEFSSDAIGYLRERVREGEKLPFTDTELLRIMADKNKSFRITFYDHKGEIFVSTQVKSGEWVKKPRLSPTFSGHWDYDFSVPITSDTEVRWIEDE